MCCMVERRIRRAGPTAADRDRPIPSEPATSVHAMRCRTHTQDRGGPRRPARRPAPPWLWHAVLETVQSSSRSGFDSSISAGSGDARPRSRTARSSRYIHGPARAVGRRAGRDAGTARRPTPCPRPHRHRPRSRRSARVREPDPGRNGAVAHRRVGPIGYARSPIRMRQGTQGVQPWMDASRTGRVVLVGTGASPGRA